MRLSALPSATPAATRFIVSDDCLAMWRRVDQTQEKERDRSAVRYRSTPAAPTLYILWLSPCLLVFLQRWERRV